MRRLFFTASLCIAMFMPGVVKADDLVFHGTNGSGGALAFNAHQRLGKYRSVHPFGTGRVLLQCSGRNVNRSLVLRDPMSVSRTGRFSGVYDILDGGPDQHTTVRIAGQFIHKQRDAIGTLRVHMDYPGNPVLDGCDSGVVDWTTTGG